MLAAENSDVAVMRLLLDRNADASAADDVILSTFSHALRICFVLMADLLLYSCREGGPHCTSLRIMTV